MSAMNRKALIIVENLPVPPDFRVWNEARTLQKAGYEVIVLCPRRKDHPKAYEYLENVHVYRHPIVQEGDSPLGHLWEYGCALFWEFVYSWMIYFRHRFQVIQGCNPPDNIFLVALPLSYSVSNIFSIIMMSALSYIFPNTIAKALFIRYNFGSSV